MESERFVRLDDGSLVERDVLNVVERITEYDPRLKVQFLARQGRISDPPYRIIELCRDGQWRELFAVWKLDMSVLDRIKAADTWAQDVESRMVINNARVRAEIKKQGQEKLDEAHDITASMVKSRKGRWSFRDGDKKVTVDDQPGIPAKVEYDASE